MKKLEKIKKLNIEKINITKLTDSESFIIKGGTQVACTNNGQKTRNALKPTCGTVTRRAC